MMIPPASSSTTCGTGSRGSSPSRTGAISATAATGTSASIARVSFMGVSGPPPAQETFPPAPPRDKVFRVGIGPELLPVLTGRRVVVGWIVLSYLSTFLVTRLVTRAIRTGRGPFRNASVGGVHLHHEVYGIFLLLGTGLVQLTYRPGPPWLYVVAALFGVGAALTLDEFALWLHLEDVYWTREGRSSVDAVLIALVVGTLLLLGANPFDDDRARGEAAVALTVAVNVVFAVVAILKGRVVLGVAGVFLPLVAVVGAVRLARPASPWARRWYSPGSRRDERSRARFPAGRRTAWTRLVDLFAVVPPPRHAGAEVAAPSRGG